MTLPTLLIVWTISLFLALTAVAVVIRPLRRLLLDLCGTAERALFWTLYAAVLIVMAPLVTVSMPGLLDAAAVAGDLGPVLQRAVFWASVGIVAALVIMGYAVWRPIATLASAPPPSADKL